MNYPLISEYVEAIKLAEDNLDKLSYLRPVLDNAGNPVMSSGNFAVVFKMKDERSGKLHALKCFIKEQEGRDKAYKLIADELEYVSSDFITPIKYLEKELFVDTSNCDVSEFPVLLMDWVEGVTLDKYIREHLHDQYALHLMTFQFCRLASWLMAQPFAHGDLKPDNILVKEDGSHVLVDYDGMYVPAMKGQKAREIGSPDYRHPLRTIEDFNEQIDDFSLATIALQLYAIALQPKLLTGSSGDTLLLCEKDYRYLEKSETMANLFSQIGSTEFEKLLAIFLLAHSESTLSKLSFRIFNINKPVKPNANLHLSTEVTDEVIANGFKDEFGAVYSRDGMRLLKGSNIEKYSIKQGTMVICDHAFYYDFCRLQTIEIPNSVTSIGNYAFYGCKSLKSIKVPNSVISIGLRAFCRCSGLISIEIPNTITSIGIDAFEKCSSLQRIILPNSVTSIGDCAFHRCSSLLFIEIPDSVTLIGRFAFEYCSNLQRVILPNSVTSIGYAAFNCCRNLRSIEIPNSITSIEKMAFSSCGIESVEIPDTVTSIEDCAFSSCKSLMSVVLPSSVSIIGERAFWNCEGLSSIIVESGNAHYDSRDECNAIIETATNTLMTGCLNTVIPSSVKNIGDYAFSGSGLTSITIPNSVTNIGDSAFKGCKDLTSIVIPNSVTNIGVGAFSNCGLANITLPNSVTTIGDFMFAYCRMTNVIIPNSVSTIGNYAFGFSLDLTSIILPDSITKIGKNVFEDCFSLSCIKIPKGSLEKFKMLFGGSYGDLLIEI